MILSQTKLLTFFPSPGKFRTNADNEKEQLYSFNDKVKDRTYNAFSSKRNSHRD